MKKIVLFFILLTSLLNGNITKYFPSLDGRVVDKANMINVSYEESITSLLKAHEDETSNQVVVVTVDSLHGYPIEDFGYQLGRHWGIGQKGRDNGVLLIVSKEDRKIRIEVGYGLEGALTDKISHEIIEYVIKPKFKSNQYNEGFSQAVDKILDAIKGEYKNDIAKEAKKQKNLEDVATLIFFITVFATAILSSIANTLKSKPLRRISNSIIPSAFASFFLLAITQIIAIGVVGFIVVFLIFFIMNKNPSFATKRSSSSYTGSSYSSGNSFGGGGFSSSGGFSGGGGGFGGGGASGGW